jgi:hypothetical protein
MEIFHTYMCSHTVDLFFDKLASWMHPNASDPKKEHQLSGYDTSCSLYQELKKAQEHLKEDVATWRDIQVCACLVFAVWCHSI